MTDEPLTKESEYEFMNYLYSLPQETIFDVMRSRYGVSVASLMKVTVDDKVRVAGLVITKAPLREYLLDLTGRSGGGDRQALDASCARRNARLQLLHANFIDPRMTTIPPKWFEAETKKKIDKFMGEGVYEEHGKLDPNNQTRISCPWTVKDTTAIFQKLDKEYHATMDKYTMGTGGGPGDDANFAAWQQRDECNVVRYTNLPSHIYLSVVHSWDKQFGFPFVSVKDPLPTECAIDSSFDFSQEDFEEDNFNNNNRSFDADQPRTPRYSVSRPRQTNTSASMTSSTRRAGSRREKGVTRALEDLTDRRTDINHVTTELLKFMKEPSSTESGTVPLQPHDVLEHISKTKKLLRECGDEMKLQRQQEEAMKGGDDSTDKKRKIHNLATEIKENRKMMAALQKTLTFQRLQLESLTNKDDKNANDAEKRGNDVSNESGMSDSSEDE